MGNGKKILIATVGIILILGFFVIVRSSRVKDTSIDKIKDVIAKNNYSVFYSGEITDDVKKDFKELKNKNSLVIYHLTDSRDDVVKYIRSIDSSANPQGNIYLVYDKTRYLGFIDDTMNRTDYLRKYIEGYIPPNEIMYKTATGSEYVQLFNSKDTLITVFGEDECSYCKQLEKVVNEISKKGVYDIYYMNFSKLSDTDQDLVYSLNIKVPKECTADKIEDKALVQGYSKPTTLVSKGGKILGCIRGYYDYTTYVSKLKEIMEG